MFDSTLLSDDVGSRRASVSRARRWPGALSVIGGAVAVLLMTPPALAQTTHTEPAPEATLPTVEVTASPEKEAGSSTKLKSEDLEKTAPTGMADVIRYQPLVEAPGAVQGSSRGASRYDRGGTTGYNVRGVEGNRVGLDIDGIEMPDAVDRSATSGGRSQSGTFGMGRDFIDPDIYSEVEIQSGTSGPRRAAGGIGGSVSFRSKSPEDFVNAQKPSYFGGQLGFVSSNRAWTKGVTAAGMNASGFSGLMTYVRRDGKQTKVHSSAEVDSYPSKWHTDALLLKGVMRANAWHRLELAADLYRKHDDSTFEAWDNKGVAVTGLSSQNAKTSRNTVALSHRWTPERGAVDLLESKLFYQDTNMKDVTETVTTAAPTGLPPGFGNAPGTRIEELSQNKTKRFGLETTGEKSMGPHTLHFGVNVSRENTSHPMRSTGDRAPMSDPYPDTSALRVGAFVLDRIRLGSADHPIVLEPGLRVDRLDTKVRVGGYQSDFVSPTEANTMYGNVPAITIVSPSLSASYALRPEFNAYAQWRRGGRAPTASEYFGYWNHPRPAPWVALVGNPNIKKETSDAFELGLKGKAAEGVQLGSALFYTKYKNFISYSRFTRANQPEQFVNLRDELNTIYKAENRDQARIYGLEVSARLDHGTWAPAVRGLYSTWALGYSQGKSKSYYAGDKWVDLDTVQPAKAIVGVGYDAPNKAWGMNLTGTFVKSKQAEATNRLSYSNNPGTELTDSKAELFRVPGFARFDVSGYWRIHKNVRLNFGIYNLADKRYWSYSNTRSLQPGTSPLDRRQLDLSTQPGRTYAVSLSASF